MRAVFFVPDHHISHVVGFKHYKRHKEQRVDRERDDLDPTDRVRQRLTIVQRRTILERKIYGRKRDKRRDGNAFAVLYRHKDRNKSDCEIYYKT